MNNAFGALLAFGLALLVAGGMGGGAQRRQQGWNPPPPHPPPPGGGPHYYPPHPGPPLGMTRQEAADLLDVSVFATEREVTRAYRAQAKLTHPDHGGSDSDFLRVAAARDVMLGRGLPEDSRAAAASGVVAFHHGGITWRIIPLSPMEFSTALMLDAPELSRELINDIIQGMAQGVTRAFGMGRHTTNDWIVVVNKLPGTEQWGEPNLIGLDAMGGTDLEEAADAAATAFIRTTL